MDTQKIANLLREIANELDAPIEAPKPKLAAPPAPSRAAAVGGTRGTPPGRTFQPLAGHPQ